MKILDQENVNSMIGVPPEIIAKLHLYYRSSVVGRREMGKELMTSIKPIKEFNYNEDISNRNVEILQAYLKAMGLRIKFFGDELNINIDTGEIISKDVGDEYVIGTSEDIRDIKIRKEIDYKYANDVVFVGTNEEFENVKEKEFQWIKDGETKYNIDIKIDEKDRW